jgi:hypothetical protein
MKSARVSASESVNLPKRNDKITNRVPENLRKAFYAELKEILGSGRSRHQMHAAIVDAAIRKQFTRQQAVRIADKNLPRALPRARLISKPLRYEQNKLTDEGRIYTPAEIDQITGNWQQAYTRTKTRPQQQAFRAKVLDAYDCTCAITDYKTEASLEAAHIQPYGGPITNEIQNGICLRADIHRLFDAGLLSIDSEYRVNVDDRVDDPRYQQYDGKRINLPRDRAKWPKFN